MLIGTITANQANIPLGFVKSMLQVKDYGWIVQEGPIIPMNRNAVFERARILGEDLLFIDSDMVFTPQDVKRVEELLKEKDVVTGICVMTYDGKTPAIFKKVDNVFKATNIQNSLFEIDACGAAFLGISKKVLATLAEPFEPILEEKWGQKHGEDISFCIRAKNEGFKIWADPTLLIGHIKTETKYYKWIN